MPKIRGFKADLWTDEDFVELSPWARLLWMGMWNYACDNGHLDDRSKQIKMRVLPTDDVNCAELLRELEEGGQIVREKGTITIPNFTRHQKPDRRYFQTCHVEGCVRPGTDSQPETRGGHQEARGGHTSTPRSAAGPHVEVKGSEVKGSDGEGTSAGKPRLHQLPKDFTPNDTNRRIAQERGLDLDEVVANFSDHHRAKGSTMKDWHLALNTWLRRERPRPGSLPSSPAVHWGAPQSLPACPAHVADDPKAYAEWVRDWNAGIDVPTADGGTARKAS